MISAEDQRHHRHHRDQHPRQLRVLRQRQDHAADRHHRRGNHHGQHHDQHLLHLGGVVGRPRDQRRRAEAVELVDRKVLDAREDRAAQNPAESGRHLRRVVAAGNGAQRGDDRHQQHQAADSKDRALIAFYDSLIDDVRHQSRQQQKADRLGERQHQHDRDVSAIRRKQTKQFQHGGVTDFAKRMTERGVEAKCNERRSVKPVSSAAGGSSTMEAPSRTPARLFRRSRTALQSDVPLRQDTSTLAVMSVMSSGCGWPCSSR